MNKTSPTQLSWGFPHHFSRGFSPWHFRVVSEISDHPKALLLGFSPVAVAVLVLTAIPPFIAGVKVCWRCLSTGTQAWFMLRLVEKDSKFDGSWLVRWIIHKLTKDDGIMNDICQKKIQLFLKSFFFQVAFERYQLIFAWQQKNGRWNQLHLGVFFVGTNPQRGGTLGSPWGRRQTSGFREQIYLERVMAMDAPAKEVSKKTFWQTKTHMSSPVGFGLGAFFVEHIYVLYI